MKDFNSMKPWGKMGRCIVNPDHSVAYFLDKDNSDLKTDGTSVDWEEVEELGQNVMVQIPKFYSAKKKVDDIFYFGVTDEPIDDDYINVDDWAIHEGFYRDRTKFCDDQSAALAEVDYRYIGAFDGWVDTKGRLRSLPNKLPAVSITIENARNAAKQMGIGWTQLDYYLMYALQMLYISEYGHPNAQTLIGRGFVDGNATRINTGGTVDKGNNTFGETTGKVQMSYRGIEDFYGNVSNWVDGFKMDGSTLKAANKGFNNRATGYEGIGSSGNVTGNIRHIQNNPKAGFLIKTVGGNNDNDGLYDHGGLYSSHFAYFGGYWASGSAAGPFYFSASHSGGGNASIGPRLCL